jgi:hypothetical protein
MMTIDHRHTDRDQPVETGVADQRFQIGRGDEISVDRAGNHDDGNQQGKDADILQWHGWRSETRGAGMGITGFAETDAEPR